MTREQFKERAVRAAERQLGVPPGWWGTWRDITDGVARVRFSNHSKAWIVSCAGHELGRYDSRRYAIGKARRMRR